MGVTDGSWQRLFQEIVIWRRLSHPNVLPVLGVSPKLFPLCVITEWMVGGNIVEFVSKHPEFNRLRLVRPISVLHTTLKYLNVPEARRSRLRIAAPAFSGHYTR